VGQTLRIPEIARDPRRHGFPPNHPEMHSFLGVPITVKGKPVGDLYLANKRGDAEFDADDQVLVERFALHAGLAIENARLSERVQALAVVEERERIGRDLHDGIIQRIYAVTLGLDDVPELLATDPETAIERVERSISTLLATIAEIRTFIYGLRPELQEGGGVTAALETLADEVRLHTPLQIDVQAAGSAAVSPNVTTELLSIAREALSNVARHAAAASATVDLSAGGNELRLEISDNGRGFDPAAPVAASHRGLANMRRRAASLGGRLEVVSGAGDGTRIILVLPLPE